MRRQTCGARRPSFRDHSASGDNRSHAAADTASSSGNGDRRATSGGSASSHAITAGQTPRAATSPDPGRKCRSDATQTGAAADFAATFPAGPGSSKEQHGFEHHNGGKERTACQRQAAECRSKRPDWENQRLSRPGSRSDCRGRLGSRAESGGKSAGAVRRAGQIVLDLRSAGFSLCVFDLYSAKVKTTQAEACATKCNPNGLCICAAPRQWRAFTAKMIL